MTTNTKNWADVQFQEKPFPTLCYRSALTVYEESLISGRFVGRAWNGAGYVNAWEEGLRLDPSKHPTPHSFWLEIDGQLLASHWEWVSFAQMQEPAGCTRRSHCGIRCDP